MTKFHAAGPGESSRTRGEIGVPLLKTLFHR